MKKLGKKFGRKNFVQSDRHIRYNWRESPESTEDNRLLRYYFIIQDDKDREGKLQKILENFQDKSIINYFFNPIESFEGKSVGTDYRYLFSSFDSNAPYTFLSFEKVSKNFKRDFDLRERVKGSLEDYVRNLYENKK